ncbi:MAG: xylulokinase, partial [Rhodobacteraceae bacterium]|nr:xylulokinase [Paracoccaceae bacterium]
MFLGLDLGTSALKAIIYSNEKIIAPISHAYPMSTPYAGWVEQDPTLWTDALKRCLSDLSQQVECSQIAGIGLTGQMHGLVCLDGSGEILRPAILWNDNRAVAQAKHLNERLPSIGQIAGIPALPSFPAVKMIWLAEHEPDVFAHITHVLMPKDYVGHVLHGGYVTDHSDAAASLWYDQA